MKILMLNYEFPPIGGGAGHAHLCILRQFARKPDLRVDVLTSASKPGLFTEQFAENITIHKVGVHKKHLHHWRRTEVVEWLAKAGRYYRRLLVRERYDLAHAFFGFPTGWVCYRRRDKLPYLISLRGSDVPGRHARLKLDYKILGPLVFKPIWKNAAALVACSEGLKRRALAFMPNASIEVIPNGVDLEEFCPAEGGTAIGEYAGLRPIRLLMVGRLSITKQVNVLIDAVVILAKGGLKVRFTVVGAGPMEARLRRIVAERNLVRIIHLIGRVGPDDMPGIYRENDIFVSASMQEGMSNAMLEAMASGLPIVTTYCEGVDELIADNGIVIDEPRADKIADAVGRLAGDRETYVRLSQAARKRAALFSWSTVAERYIGCYRAVLEHRDKNL